MRFAFPIKFLFLVLCFFVFSFNVFAQQPSHPHYVLFGSLDVNKNAFLTFGFKKALTGSLYQSGPVVLGSVGFGADTYSQFVEQNALISVKSAMLVGYQTVIPQGVISVFIGPEYERQQRLSGENTQDFMGVRVQSEAWIHPSTDTLINSTFIFGSARGDLWSRTGIGLKMLDIVYVGPEIVTYIADDFREYRVGAHVTGFKFGDLNFRLSAGFQKAQREQGPYGSLVVYQNF